MPYMYLPKNKPGSSFRRRSAGWPRSSRRRGSRPAGRSANCALVVLAGEHSVVRGFRILGPLPTNPDPCANLGFAHDVCVQIGGNYARADPRQRHHRQRWRWPARAVRRGPISNNQLLRNRGDGIRLEAHGHVIDHNPATGNLGRDCRDLTGPGGLGTSGTFNTWTLNKQDEHARRPLHAVAAEVSPSSWRSARRDASAASTAPPAGRR